MRDTYCSFCGTAYATKAGGQLSYPRTCVSADCGRVIWANPIPVAVVLVPVQRKGREGLLVVRRGIEPGRGKLALVGGFLEEHESWQEGGAREVFEETGVKVDNATLEPLWYTSTEPRPNRVLLFSMAKPIDALAAGAFTPNAETLERGLVYGPDGLDEVMAFPLHVQAARRFFEARGASGQHAFEAWPQD